MKKIALFAAMAALSLSACAEENSAPDGTDPTCTSATCAPDPTKIKPEPVFPEAPATEVEVVPAT